MAKHHISMFLREAGKILGAGGVITDGPVFADLSIDPVFTSCPPIAFIYPRSTNEVVKLVKLAKKHSTVIWPYSTAKNWGYCNTAGTRDAVVMILEKMNRILHVDEELAYAEIEPGVTYRQLNSYIKERKFKLWTDCTGGPPTGSVVGNALDRGIGTTPYGDHYASLCGLEVVLPNGDVIRTGGFGKKEGAWHTYKWGIGPSVEGLFAQSNYGIVTRAGMWLMRKPDDFVVGGLSLSDHDSLAKALDAFRELMFAGAVPDKARFSNDVALLTLITQAIDERMEGKTALSVRDLAALKRKYSVPAWSGSFGIYGLKGHVKFMRREAKKKLAGLGNIHFTGETKSRFARAAVGFFKPFQGTWAEPLVSAFFNTFIHSSLALIELLPELIDIHKGDPNESVVRRAYFRHPAPRPSQNINVPKDGVGVMWFVPLVPFRGAEIEAYLAACKPLFERYKLDYYVTIIMMNSRTTVPLMVLLYQLDDPDSCRRAKGLYDALYKDALSRGYQQFRCGQAGWDKIFTDCPELKHLHETLKKTLDPDGLIAPGRYGIGNAA